MHADSPTFQDGSEDARKLNAVTVPGMEQLTFEYTGIGEMNYHGTRIGLKSVPVDRTPCRDRIEVSTGRSNTI